MHRKDEKFMKNYVVKIEENIELGRYESTTGG
jgi:hypothetical protein